MRVIKHHFSKVLTCFLFGGFLPVAGGLAAQTLWINKPLGSAVGLETISPQFEGGNSQNLSTVTFVHGRMDLPFEGLKLILDLPIEQGRSDFVVRDIANPYVGLEAWGSASTYLDAGFRLPMMKGGDADPVNFSQIDRKEAFLPQVFSAVLGFNNVRQLTPFTTLQGRIGFTYLHPTGDQRAGVLLNPELHVEYGVVFTQNLRIVAITAGLAGFTFTSDPDPVLQQIELGYWSGGMQFNPNGRIRPEFTIQGFINSEDTAYEPAVVNFSLVIALDGKY